MALQRLDALLVHQGIASGRDQAKAYILSGQVLVDGQRIDKAGAMVAETADIVFAGKANPFVSRGGLKLAKALAQFSIDLSGRRVLDLGASTGGFTDCALQNGAAQVVADRQDDHAHHHRADQHQRKGARDRPLLLRHASPRESALRSQPIAAGLGQQQAGVAGIGLDLLA